MLILMNFSDNCNHYKYTKSDNKAKTRRLKFVILNYLTLNI